MGSRKQVGRGATVRREEGSVLSDVIVRGIRGGGLSHSGGLPALQ